MVWPASLPLPKVEGYGGTDNLPLIRTEMETGPPRVTRVSDTYMVELTASVALTPAQFDTFRTFLEGEANAGANWFDVDLDTGGTVTTHRARITSVSHTVIVPEGLYNISLGLETDERWTLGGQV